VGKWLLLFRENWLPLLREKWYFVCIILLVLWLASMGSCISVSGKVKVIKSDVGLLEQEVSVLKGEEVQLQKRINNMEGTISALTTERDNLRAEVQKSKQSQETPKISYSVISLHIDLRMLLTKIEDLLIAEMGAHYELDEGEQAAMHSAILSAHSEVESLLSLVPEDADISQVDIDIVQRRILSLQESFNDLAQKVMQWEEQCQLPEITKRTWRIERPKHYEVYINAVSEQITLILKYLPYLPIQGQLHSG